MKEAGGGEVVDHRSEEVHVVLVGGGKCSEERGDRVGARVVMWVLGIGVTRSGGRGSWHSCVECQS